MRQVRQAARAILSREAERRAWFRSKFLATVPLGLRHKPCGRDTNVIAGMVDSLRLRVVPQLSLSDPPAAYRPGR
jgi:hypothetical protein